MLNAAARPPTPPPAMITLSGFAAGASREDGSDKASASTPTALWVPL